MNTSTPPTAQPARNPSETWRRIVGIGGLEPRGRDSDFVDLVRTALDPDASTIVEALATCPNNETLVRAVFGVVAPFSAMSQDIVDFMRRADARRGKASIQIAIENSIVGLEHLEEFAKTLRQAPGVTEIWDATIQDAFDLANAAGRSVQGRTLPLDVKSWLAAFARGEFRELPPSLHPERVAAELGDLASIAATALATLRSVIRFREEKSTLLAKYRHPDFGGGRVRDPIAVAMAEHDLVGPLIGLLGQAAMEEDHSALVAAIRPVFARIPRLPVSTTGELATLEKVLSLPAWKKRFELYAVWIATRIAGAVEPERVAVHTDAQGALPFAFKATHLATIESADGEKRLWAERRERCVDPIGKNRTGHVQPDYGLWFGPEGADRCDLIVEVKHYKTPALTTFGAALVDYAKAHPHATTVLVNYGPEAGVADHERWSHHGVLRRCHEIGDLTPYNRVACDAFRELVREAAGPEPHPRLLLLDVSGSTSDGDGGLRTRSVARSWLSAPEQAHLKRVVAASEAIQWDLPLVEAVARLDKPVDAAGGDPLAVAQELLHGAKRIWIATDSSGVSAFKTAGFRHFRHLRHMTGIDLVEVGSS
ncbi:hypothetical protein FHR20_000066 [Sphingomonas leidyi]|uniref:Uncharacterized protein n=1 Tax=Sphingomonas leidyi TaxID=68569 RepID=A0A7X5ZTM2_9SPHN|nr:hypothetical protein [Sphingomonas leidyi]NIJ63135.1 hypothetical protein [Sphingomonas leidyi]